MKLDNVIGKNELKVNFNINIIFVVSSQRQAEKFANTLEEPRIFHKNPTSDLKITYLKGPEKPKKIMNMIGMVIFLEDLKTTQKSWLYD